MSEVSTPVVSNINTNPTPPPVKDTVGKIPPKESDGGKPLAVEKQKFKVQIDGKDTELDEDTVVKWYRDEKKLKAGDQKLAEAAKLQKAIQARIDELNKKEESLKPLTELEGEEAFKYLLNKHQDSPDKLKKIRAAMENYLVEQIKQEDEAPEVRALREAQRREEQLKKQIKDREDQDKQTQLQKLTEEQRGIYEKKVISTIELSGLPPTEWNIRSVAELMQKAMKAGVEPSPDTIAEIVLNDRVDNLKALSKTITDKVLEAYQNKDYDTVLSLKDKATRLYGDDVFKALRAIDLSSIRKDRAQVPEPVIETPKVAKDGNQPKKLGWDEARELRQKEVAELDKQWRATGKLG